MKKQILVAGILLVSMVSCGALSSVSSGTTAPQTTKTTANTSATQAGKNAGAALDALTAQYKADGKIDMKNFTNLAHILNLIESAQGLKEHKNDVTYKKGFIQGLIANSINIDTETAPSITDKLQDLADQADTSKLQNSVQQNQAPTVEVQNVANRITSIISTFKE